MEILRDNLASTRGFSILELITVIAIVSVLMVVALPNYHMMRANVVSTNGAQEIIAALRTSQNKAVASQDGIAHGVRFESDRYIAFGGSWSSPTYATTFQLEKGLSITQGAGTSVMFDRLSGGAAASEIRLESSSGSTYRIIVDVLGAVRLET
jgi:prepilin-type N-terminal cleavage/methylation domain-containing protein